MMQINTIFDKKQKKIYEKDKLYYKGNFCSQTITMSNNSYDDDEKDLTKIISNQMINSSDITIHNHNQFGHISFKSFY